MSTIPVPDSDFSSLGGMSTQLRERTALAEARNGLPAIARPLWSAEQACQYLAASRKIPLQVQSGLISQSTADGTTSYPLTRLVREEYSKLLTAIILYSTETDGITPAFQLRTDQDSTWRPAVISYLPPTAGHTRVAAIEHTITEIVLGAGDATDYGLVEIDLQVSSNKPATSGTIYIYGVSLFSQTLREIAI